MEEGDLTGGNTTKEEEKKEKAKLHKERQERKERKWREKLLKEEEEEERIKEEGKKRCREEDRLAILQHHPSGVSTPELQPNGTFTFESPSKDDPKFEEKMLQILQVIVKGVTAGTLSFVLSVNGINAAAAGSDTTATAVDTSLVVEQRYEPPAEKTRSKKFPFSPDVVGFSICKAANELEIRSLRLRILISKILRLGYKNGCYATNEYLMRELNIPKEQRRNFERLLNQAIEQGFITEENRDGRRYLVPTAKTLEAVSGPEDLEMEFVVIYEISKIEGLNYADKLVLAEIWYRADETGLYNMGTAGRRELEAKLGCCERTLRNAIGKLIEYGHIKKIGNNGYQIINETLFKEGVPDGVNGPEKLGSKAAKLGSKAAKFAEKSAVTQSVAGKEKDHTGQDTAKTARFGSKAAKFGEKAAKFADPKSVENGIGIGVNEGFCDRDQLYQSFYQNGSTTLYRDTEGVCDTEVVQSDTEGVSSKIKCSQNGGGKCCVVNPFGDLIDGRTDTGGVHSEVQVPVDPEAEKLGNAAMLSPAVAEHIEEQPVRDSEQLLSATLRAGMESGELPGNAEPQTELALLAKTRNPDSLPTVGGTFSAGGALPAGKLSQNCANSEPKSPQISVFEGGAEKVYDADQNSKNEAISGKREAQAELPLSAKTVTNHGPRRIGFDLSSAGGALPAGKLSQNCANSEPKSPQISVFEGGAEKVYGTDQNSKNEAISGKYETQTELPLSAKAKTGNRRSRRLLTRDQKAKWFASLRGLYPRQDEAHEAEYYVMNKYSLTEDLAMHILDRVNQFKTTGKWIETNPNFDVNRVPRLDYFLKFKGWTKDIYAVPLSSRSSRFARRPAPKDPTSFNVEDLDGEAFAVTPPIEEQQEPKQLEKGIPDIQIEEPKRGLFDSETFKKDDRLLPWEEGYKKAPDTREEQQESEQPAKRIPDIQIEEPKRNPCLPKHLKEGDCILWWDLGFKKVPEGYDGYEVARKVLRGEMELTVDSYKKVMGKEMFDGTRVDSFVPSCVQN
jgi:hypothetical protein